jgi:hypothetical protein
MKKRTPAKRSKPKHLCFEQVDEELRKHNTRLVRPVQVDFNHQPVRLRMHLALATEKIDRKKRHPAKTVVAAYCPFCGKKLDGES